MQSFQLGGSASVLSKKETDAMFNSVILKPQCCCSAFPARTCFRTALPCSPILPKHQHDTSTYPSWAPHPFWKTAMAEIFGTVLWSNAPGARECTFSTLEKNWIGRSLQTSLGQLVAGHVLLHPLPPQPWESVMKETFLSTKQFESIIWKHLFVLSRQQPAALEFSIPITGSGEKQRGELNF